MKRKLELFKTNITPAQVMKMFMAPKDSKRAWPEYYMYLMAILEACGGDADYLVLSNIVVQYASANLGTVLMAKVDITRGNYLQQTEELAHFVQSWELEPARYGNLGKEVVGAVADRAGGADLTLAMNATSAETDEVQRIQLAPVDSDNESHGMRCCANVETYGRVLRWGIVHNLITYYKLDKKGFMLTYKAGRRVVAVNSKGRVAFDIDIRRDVLIAGRTRLRALRALVARQSSIGEEEKKSWTRERPMMRSVGR
ncbi:hypothetical protein PC123_g8563 [Phytophthora cactorum]|nr:hypothetical protein PC120_g8191 [Phytophthora cactorum]KAG4056404.1 hypothetical protein PC123_g8563 [Phytophthora cactorum]